MKFNNMMQDEDSTRNITDYQLLKEMRTYNDCPTKQSQLSQGMSLGHPKTCRANQIAIREQQNTEERNHIV